MPIAMDLDVRTIRRNSALRSILLIILALIKALLMIPHLTE
jgi:hypothetical protein